MTCSDVADHLRNKEWAELRSVLDVLAVVNHFVLEGLNTADAHTEHHSNPVLVDFLQIHAAVFHCLDGTGKRILRVTVKFACFLAVDVLVGVEALHLASKLSLEFRGVEISDSCCTALSCYEVVPCFLRIESHRCHGTKACHYYSF